MDRRPFSGRVCNTVTVPRHIAAITFDVGGTLIEPWPSVGHVYSEVAGRHSLGRIPPDVLNRRFQAAWRAARSFGHLRSDWEQLVAQVFQGLTKRSPDAAFFPDLYERFARPEAWRVFDDVRPILDRLAGRGIRLGVISNWDERLRLLLRRMELLNYFEVLAISCEVGSPKPSARIFHHAATSLGLPARSILHVGDHPELDVRAAIAAGFDARLLDRHPGASGPCTLSSLTELSPS